VLFEVLAHATCEFVLVSVDPQCPRHRVETERELERPTSLRLAMIDRERSLAGVVDERELRLVVALEVGRTALPLPLVAGVRDVEHRGRAQVAQLPQEVQDGAGLFLAVLVGRALQARIRVERDQAPVDVVTRSPQSVAPVFVVELHASVCGEMKLAETSRCDRSSACQAIESTMQRGSSGFLEHEQNGTWIAYSEAPEGRHSRSDGNRQVEEDVRLALLRGTDELSHRAVDDQALDEVWRVAWVRLDEEIGRRLEPRRCERDLMLGRVHAAFLRCPSSSSRFQSSWRRAQANGTSPSSRASSAATTSASALMRRPSPSSIDTRG